MEDDAPMTPEEEARLEEGEAKVLSYDRAISIMTDYAETLYNKRKFAKAMELFSNIMKFIERHYYNMHLAHFHEEAYAFSYNSSRYIFRLHKLMNDLPIWHRKKYTNELMPYIISVLEFPLPDAIDCVDKNVDHS